MFQFLDDVQKRRFFNALLSVAILLAVFLGLQSINSLKQYSYIGKGVYPSNVISVTGKGEVYAVPDTGSFSFSVVEEGKTVGVAQEKSAKKINQIIEKIKSLGVLEKDIKTTNYNSYPKYDYSREYVCTNGYCPPVKQVLAGYEVSQTISVKIRKTSDAGAVLTEVGELGATNISSLEFVVDDIDSVKEEAKDKAIDDAKARAEVLSKSLGVKFKRIISFYENDNQPPMYYSMSAMEKNGMGGDMARPTVPEIPTGENKITSSVTITFEIE